MPVVLLRTKMRSKLSLMLAHGDILSPPSYGWRFFSQIRTIYGVLHQTLLTDLPDLRLLHVRNEYVVDEC